MCQRFAKFVILAVLVAVIAVPRPLAACCRAANSAGDVRQATCCDHCPAADRQAALEAAACCGDSDSTGSCATGICGCCHPADARNLPPTRVENQPSFAAGFFLTGTTRFDADVAAGSLIDCAAPAGSVSAIPHRILHCSWLI